MDLWYFLEYAILISMQKVILISVLILNILLPVAFGEPPQTIMKQATIEHYIVKNNDNNKYGIIDKSNKIIIQPVYDEIKTEGETSYLPKKYYEKVIFRTKLNNKYGLADTNGKILYEPQLDEISRLGHNNVTQTRYLKVKKNSKYALFDIKEKELSDFIFDEISLNSIDEIQVVKDGKKYLLYPAKGILKGVGIVLFAPVALVCGLILAPFALISLFFSSP